MGGRIDRVADSARDTQTLKSVFEKCFDLGIAQQFRVRCRHTRRRNYVLGLRRKDEDVAEALLGLKAEDQGRNIKNLEIKKILK